MPRTDRPFFLNVDHLPLFATLDAIYATFRYGNDPEADRERREAGYTADWQKHWRYDQPPRWPEQIRKANQNDQP